MRGKVSHIATIALYTGITPAHAGKSYDERYEKSLGKDHPRTCGEKASCLCIFALSLGSPPHMRGKVHTLIVLYDNHGITPAHAGKSYIGKIMYAPCKDHPRTCGEKRLMNSTKNQENGSPPHMRGKDRRDSTVRKAFRITPAHAGKSILTQACFSGL